jgi:hypothetical protein
MRDGRAPLVHIQLTGTCRILTCDTERFFKSAGGFPEAMADILAAIDKASKNVRDEGTMGMSAEIREVRHTVTAIKEDVTVIGKTVSDSSTELAVAARKIRSLEASLERKFYNSNCADVMLTIFRIRERATD